jgi:hypothetical protein
MGDVCVPMLGRRQRLLSRLMMPETKDPNIGKKTHNFQKIAAQVALFVPELFAIA